AGNTSNPSTPVELVVDTAVEADAPVLTANDDGSVTAQPGADNIQQVITYINEAGTPVTLTATKAENGSWTLDNTPTDVSIDAITGVVTLQPDAVTDFTQVDSTGTDQYDNTADRTEENTSEDNSPEKVVCRLLLENNKGRVTAKTIVDNIHQV